MKLSLPVPAGIKRAAPSAYDETLALFPDDVCGFLKDSQPAKWQALEALLGSKTAPTVLDDFAKELELKGTLHVPVPRIQTLRQYPLAWLGSDRTPLGDHAVALERRQGNLRLEIRLELRRFAIVAGSSRPYAPWPTPTWPSPACAT